MRILIAGGAGYIGGFVCDELLKQGMDVVLMDDFSTGHKYVVEYLLKKYGNKKLRVIEGNVGNLNDLRKCWNERIDGVVYLVSKIYVQEAAEDPLLYFHHNLSLFIQFLTFMIKATGTRVFVFSSTGTVYGETPNTPVDETYKPNPTNPYSETKLSMERICRYVEQAHGLRWMALRYFNAAGASLDTGIGEDHPDERHLIPLVFQACKEQKPISIFGEDYPTPDGTTVRDYIHVLDLATAHTAALKHLADGKPCGAYNVGTGHGYSVKQIVDYTLKFTGADLEVKKFSRRPGDVAYSVANAEKIQRDLQWKPEFSKLDTIIETAWKWANR